MSSTVDSKPAVAKKKVRSKKKKAQIKENLNANNSAKINEINSAKRANLNGNMTVKECANKLKENPVVTLNHLQGCLKFCYGWHTGPSNEVIHTATVKINGKEYIGMGADQKKARIVAALAALDDIRMPQTSSLKGSVQAATMNKSVPVTKNLSQLTKTPVATMDKSVPATKNSKQLMENPITTLNNIRKSIEYCDISKTVPPRFNDPSIFTFSVVVDGRQYIGFGPSKKEAKAAAALNALDGIKKPESFPEPTSTTSTNMTGENVSDPFTAIESVEQNKSATNKCPISFIYENYPNVIFTCDSIDGDSSFRFKVTCKIDNQNYEGYGPNKQCAKLSAAKVALATLGVDQPIKSLPKPPEITKPPKRVSPASYYQLLADRVAKAVIDKFNELMKGDSVYVNHKVLAGIVMTYGPDYENMEVISVSTGTKCVSGERLSTCGLAVNDCHAEVICRRGFQEYIYDCLKNIAESVDGKGSKDNPLELSPIGGYQLRRSHKFHLYISTAPCGDATIFSPHEDTCQSADGHPNRQARGQLRTKIESGEGTIPVKNNDDIQTWDGILQGERLLTMSCSDKIARWNVLGLQGALLSVFVKPIYLESIIFGSLMHPYHSFRALCGRLLGSLKDLPSPFQLNIPNMVQCSFAVQRQVVKAPSYSVNWTKGRKTVEIVNATTGKTINASPSILCKQNMFKKWLRLVSNLSPTPQINWDAYNCTPVVQNASHRMKFDVNGAYYDIAKSKAVLYQDAKTVLFNSFSQADLGKWLKKPIEQDQFTIYKG